MHAFSSSAPQRFQGWVVCCLEQEKDDQIASVSECCKPSSRTMMDFVILCVVMRKACSDNCWVQNRPLLQTAGKDRQSCFRHLLIQESAKFQSVEDLRSELEDNLAFDPCKHDPHRICERQSKSCMQKPCALSQHLRRLRSLQLQLLPSCVWQRKISNQK